MVKITGGQRIDLLGITKEKLPDVWRDLGMPSGHAYTKAFRTCKTCVGTDFCRYGVGDSTALGIAIEKRFQGIESPAKMKLAANGCPRNCAEATTKDLGAVAIEGGRWEVYVGGAAGSRVRKGDVLCVVDTHEDVLRYMGRFMQYYREQARYLERTYDFVERLGIETLRRILVDDAEGMRGAGSTPRSRPRWTPTRIPGSRPTSPSTRTSSAPPCPRQGRAPCHGGNPAAGGARTARGHPARREGRTFVVGKRGDRGVPHTGGPPVRHPGLLPARPRPAGRRHDRRRGRVVCPLHSFAFDLESGRC